MKRNTRIAPSPTGDMHVGTARTAYFNWLAARATGGSFTLRIDDTDKERSKPEYVDDIIAIMEWLGLGYDSIVYQSQRFDLYQSEAHRLLTGTPGGRFAKEKDGAIVLDLGLDNLREKGIAPGYPKSWTDEISGPIAITENDLSITEGMVLIKSDGSPSYNFASIVDDMTLGTNYVIRGGDHITNTSKQVILFNVLHPDTGLPDDPVLPSFAHLGLIAYGGKLLSKRDGAASMLHYKDAGYDPDAMLNFLARLGWGPKVDDKTTKMLPRERMLELFIDGGNLRSSQANMDMAKLEALDRKYKAQKGVWRNKDRLMES